LARKSVTANPATHRNTPQHTAKGRNILERTVTHSMSGYDRFVSNTLKHTATHCNTLQHTVTFRHTTTRSKMSGYNWFAGNTLCNTLQHTQTRCNTLQHTATHCQHTASHSKMSGYDRFAGAEGLRGLCNVKSVVADRCVAACGSAVQCVAAFCSVLRCAAVCCNDSFAARRACVIVSG